MSTRAMNDTANKVFANTAGQVILRSIDVVIGIASLALITRYLGQSGFGHYTTVYAILQLFVVIIDLGLYLTLLREISSSEETRIPAITNNIFTIRVVSSVALLALAILTISLSPYPAEVKFGTMTLSASFLFATLIATLTALFQKHLQMVKIALLNLVNKLLFFAATIIIVSQGLGLQAIFIGASLASVLSFALLWYLLRTIPTPVRLAFAYDPVYWKRVLSISWPLAVTTALNLIYFKADTIILSLYHAPEAVGIYGASYRVLEIIASFPHMFMGLILPLLTAAWVAHDDRTLHAIWRKAFAFFAFISFPMIVGALVVGRPLMRMIVGDDFSISGDLLKILVVATAAIFFGTLYTYMVLVIDRQRDMIRYFLITAALALVGYFLFIPSFSFWGAAWVTVASEILIVIGAWTVIKQSFTPHIPWAICGKLASASAFMGIVTWLLLPFVPLLPLIVLAAAIYFITTLLIRAITITELRTLILPRRNGTD